MALTRSPLRSGAALLLAGLAVAAAIAALLRDGSPRRATAPARTAHEAPPREPGPVEAAEPCAALLRVEGLVLDPEGRPLAGAAIWVGPEPREIATCTEEDGGFAVESDLDRIEIGARAKGLAPSDLRVVVASDGALQQLVIRLTGPGGTLRGRVVDGKGSGVPGAVLHVGGGAHHPPGPLTSEDGHALLPAPAAVLLTDAEGRYFADDLPAEWSVVFAGAPGFAFRRAAVRLIPGGTVDSDLVLEPGATVQGVVRDELGAFVPDVSIGFMLEDGGFLAATESDGSGAFRLFGAPSGRVRLGAERSGRAFARGTLEVTAGGEARWDPVLVPALRISGRIEEADGTPAAGARLRFAADGERSASATADERGLFESAPRPSMPHRIDAWRAGAPPHAMPAASTRVEPGGGEVVVTLPPPPPAGSLRGTIARADGTPAMGSRVRLWPSGSPNLIGESVADVQGAFLFESVAPGTYRVEIHRDGDPTLHLAGVDVRDAVDLGALRYPAPGRVRCRVVPDLGGHPLHLRSHDGAITYVWHPPVDGEFVSEDLQAGRYLLLLGETGLLREIAVLEGREEAVTLARAETVRVTVRCEGEQAGAVTVALSDAEGRPLRPTRLEPLVEGRLALDLVAGRYVLRARDARGRTGEATFDVAGQPLEVVVTIAAR